MQDRQHFVYVLNCGTYDADGYQLRIFGVSSLKSFANRYHAYMPGSLIQPELCGVVVCDSREEALATERAILSRLWKDAPPNRVRSEIRRASEDVLDFIENEMEDGTAYLGMTAKAFSREAQRAYHKTEQFKRSQRAYWQQPGKKQHRNKRQREYARATRRRKRRGGNSPGQMTLF